MCDYHIVDAAGGDAEADEVAEVTEVTKQLEKQAIEDKEKDEDGDEGGDRHRSGQYFIWQSVTAVCVCAQTEMMEKGLQEKRRRKRRRKDVS